MTRENAKKQAEVMMAYAEGKPIQVKDVCSYGPWEDTVNPLFDWSSRNYRVKPEPNYVPYKDAYEFLEALINHSGDLILKDSSGRARSIEQIDFTDNTVKISPSPIRPDDGPQWYMLSVVLKSFTFTDNAKCGCLNISNKNLKS